jgi:hypothetical protein
MNTCKCKQEKFRRVALGLPACTPSIGMVFKTLFSIQQQKSTPPVQAHCCHGRNLQHRQLRFVLSFLKSKIVLTSRQPHILLLPLHKTTENTSTHFALSEYISPIPILRNNRSGRGRPRSSAETLMCSPCK